MKSRVFLLALLLLLIGCGGGSSANSSSGTLSGNWQMTLQKTGTTKFAKTQSGSLVQNNGVISGSVILTDTPCSGVGNVSGTVTGTAVSMVVSPTGVVVNQTGTVSSDQSSMSGNYTILSTGCSGSQTAPQSGTWTANLVKPLTGNFQGTFTSNKAGALPVTGQVSQGPNTGSSNTALTGNLSITGYCFSAANISGVISGTAVVMNLVDSSGVEIAQVTGTSSLDGTSLTGTYHAIAQGTGGTSPCVDGDSGTVSLTL